MAKASRAIAMRLLPWAHALLGLFSSSAHRSMDCRHGSFPLSALSVNSILDALAGQFGHAGQVMLNPSLPSGSPHPSLRVTGLNMGFNRRKMEDQRRDVISSSVKQQHDAVQPNPC